MSGVMLVPITDFQIADALQVAAKTKAEVTEMVLPQTINCC